MALARLALKNLHHRVSASSSASAFASLLGHELRERAIGCVQRQRWWENEFVRRFATAAGDHEASDGKEVAVTEGDNKKSKLFRRRRGRRDLWRDNERDFVPALYEFFPSGLGNALLQATENISKLFGNLNISPSQLIGQVKEQDECYKLRYEVPGFGKEDLKITAHDGILTIKGEHKEEKDEQGSDDEHWSSRSYVYTSLLLPDDAKVDEIKAELKDGVLNIIIPRSEEAKKDVKEVEIH